MAQIILDSNNNLIQGDFDNATINNRTKFKTTTTNATTNVYAVPNGSATSAGFTATNAADPTNASKITMATNGSTDVQIISGVNGSGTYLPLSFYTNNTLAMQIGTNGQITVAATANPTFSAYNSSATSLSNGSNTKVQFQTENWDTNNNYDTSNGRFTPTVAGYYQINTGVAFAVYQNTESYLMIYKNGSIYQVFHDYIMSRLYNFSGGTIVYCNGTTDYIEVYVFQSYGSAVNTVTGNANTYFNASMIRSA